MCKKTTNFIKWCGEKTANLFIIKTVFFFVYK